MTNIEKAKQIRQATLAPFNKINEALVAANGDVEKATELVMQQMTKTDVAAMAARQANATIVYSYVHNNRIGAMLTIACQTDFVAKNELFLNLAKEICMHIVSSPFPPEYVCVNDIPPSEVDSWKSSFEKDLAGKPAAVQDKIFIGKCKKKFEELCLLSQPFVKDETITIEQLIANVSAQTREKIEVKKFVRMVAS